MPQKALVKDGYIFSLGALIYSSLNNDTKLKDGNVELTQIFIRSKTKFLEKELKQNLLMRIVKTVLKVQRKRKLNFKLLMTQKQDLDHQKNNKKIQI